MRQQLEKIAAVLLVTALYNPLFANINTNAEWEATTSNGDLNTPTNWSGGTVPDGIATFDSTIASINLNPTATTPFSLDNIYFADSASAFLFTFTGPAALTFTGLGITGVNTNTQINATNSGSMTTAQVLFDVSDASSSSIGSAKFSLINSSTGTISSGETGQMILANGNNVPIAAGNEAVINVVNNGTILGTGNVGQVFLKGSSFTAGDQFTFNAENTGTMTGRTDTGQLMCHSGNTLTSFVVGNNARFNFTNGNTESSGTIHSTNSNVGQIVYDGFASTSLFTAGDNAAFTFTNQNGSSISSATTGDDAGQIVLDGNSHIVSFTTGGYANLVLTNEGGSTISGLGFDGGQIVVDGDGGNASFAVGSYSTLNMSNGSGCTIESGSDGNDAAQLVIDGNSGSASFASGDNSSITLLNNGTITSLFNTGQIVVDGDSGSASFTLGNNNGVMVTNNASIINTSTGSLAGQVVFNGSQATSHTLLLDAGNGAYITAVNGVDGTIVNNSGTDLAAQMRFNNTVVNGGVTLTAINQQSTPGPFEGIIFDGTSTASNANIALQNSSLVLNTNASLFTIASLAGDENSFVKLSNDLRINTVSGASTSFDGIISQVSGLQNLTIDGSGTQALNGPNTFTGLTSVNNAALILNGSVISDVQVNGGALSGAGTIGGNLTLASGGSVNPGDPLGALNINQNYTQNAGTTYYVNISGTLSPSGTPQSSQLAIIDGATLAGTVEVESIDGTYAIGQPYTILTSNSITGTFDLVEAVNPLLVVTPIYNLDPSVQILLSTDFLTAAVTSNQKHVATQLDSIGLPSSDEALVIDSLLSIPLADVPEAFDEMSGEQYTYLVRTSQYADRGFNRRVFDAIRNDSFDPCSCECGKLVTWSTFEAGKVFAHGNHESRGYKQSMIDISLGSYTALNECTLLGVAANFEETHQSFNLPGHNKLYDGQGSIHAMYTNPDYYLFSDLIVGRSNSQFKRDIEFGSLDRRAHGSPNLWHGLWYGEAGLTFERCNLELHPFVAVDVSYTSFSKIREHGANSLNLEIHSHQETLAHSYLGSHASYVGGCWEINGDIAWLCRLGPVQNKLHSNFRDFGTTYSIVGSQYGRNSIYGNLNLSGQISERFSLYSELSGEYWNHWSGYSGSVGASYSW